MNYIKLITEGFSDKNDNNSWSKSIWNSFPSGRRAVENLLVDQKAKLSISQIDQIVDIAKKDYYFGWIIRRHFIRVLEDDKRVNEKICIDFSESILKKEVEDLEKFKSIIVDWLSSKRENKNIKNIFKFSIFKSEAELVSFLKEKSKKSLKAFSSIVALRENNLPEEEFDLVKARLKKTINKLVPNNKNASLVCKGISSEAIRDWISQDEEMRSNLIDFIPQFSARDLQSAKMVLGKGILSIYKSDKINFDKAQKYLISLMCLNYYRYENRVLQLLQVEGSSPRNAFATVLSLDKDPSFLCKKYPELKKFQTIM